MRLSIRSAIFSTVTSVAVLVASASAFASDWEVDSGHSHVGFAVRHMMVSTLHGTFDKYSGLVALDDGDITKSKAHFEIDASSIDTSNAKRDEHLKSPDFFDVAHFPKITFDASKVEKRGADGLSLTGNLTIKNVTKPVVFAVTGVTGEVKDPWGGIRRGASAQAKISRKDFGLTWNKSLDTGGVVVGDDVTLELEVELTKKKVDKG
jgi:polyisoprenoid-binding protein YceI